MTPTIIRLLSRIWGLQARREMGFRQRLGRGRDIVAGSRILAARERERIAA